MTTSSNLKDLIELLNDGEKFYSEAADRVKIPAYANLFRRMAQQKQAIASDLSARLAVHGEVAPMGGTVLGTLRKLYAEVLASMSKQSESVYVAQLEQTEDRILEAFRDEVTTALHKINPKASRENLAQFLNHLFLGGQAPAPVDADILDKSVAIRVRDLHEASDAFQRPAESDIKDRRLHEFSDDAPQTASHPLMRQARAQDHGAQVARRAHLQRDVRLEHDALVVRVRHRYRSPIDME